MNITGLATLQNELSAKRLDLLTEAVLSVKSVVILTNPVLDAAHLARLVGRHRAGGRGDAPPRLRPAIDSVR